MQAMRGKFHKNGSFASGFLTALGICLLFVMLENEYSKIHLRDALQSSKVKADGNFSLYEGHWPERPRLEVFLLTWNDIQLLPYTVRFYRERMGLEGLRITVYDNESNDGTPELAKALGCHIVTYSTGDQLNDQTNANIRNDCWKNSEADWIIISDLDEWVDVRPAELNQYEASNVTVVKTDGVSLVWRNDTHDLTEAPHGVWGDIAESNKYSKPCLFYKPAITEYSSAAGGHSANPEGNVKWLTDAQPRILPPRLYHAKYFSEKYLLERGRVSSQRLSQYNKDHGYGQQYFEAAVSSISANVAEIRQVAGPIPGLNGSIFTRGEAGSPI